MLVDRRGELTIPAISSIVLWIAFLLLVTYGIFQLMRFVTG